MTDPASPRPFSDTPPPPSGVHDLRLVAGTPIKVFVDANVFFRWTYRAALAASAREGDLGVYWSPAIQSEIRRVSERETTIAVARRAQSLPPDERQSAIDVALERVSADRTAQIAALEPFFHVVAPAIDDVAEIADVPDPDDRLHILAARAVNAAYLLTLDDRHLPHGAVFAGVHCWHPDTFLTLFYQQNPAAYTRARRSIAHLPAALRLRLLP